MKRIGVILILLLVLLLPAAISHAAPFDRIIRKGETVDEDVNVFDGNLTVEEGGTLNGEVNIFDGTADVAGTVNGNVTIFDGEMTLSGSVDGNVVLFSGDLHIAEGATVGGDCLIFGGDVEDDSRAASCAAFGERFDPESVLGAIPRPQRPERPPVVVRPPGLVAGVAHFFLRVSEVVGRSLLMGLLALVVASVFPSQLGRVSDTLARKPAASGAVGVLTAVAAPSIVVLLLIVLGITLIGILLYPAVCLLALLPLAALALGWIAVGDRFGRWIAGRLSLDNRSLAITATVGTTLLTLLLGALDLLPFFTGGWLIATLLAVAGLGAAALTQFGTRVYPPAVARAKGDVAFDEVPPTKDQIT
jgi:hypothetical protein